MTTDTEILKQLQTQTGTQISVMAGGDIQIRVTERKEYGHGKGRTCFSEPYRGDSLQSAYATLQEAKNA